MALLMRVASWGSNTDLSHGVLFRMDDTSSSSTSGTLVLE